MSWPVKSNRFSVSLGVFTMSCAKIRNISRQIQYDVLKEGGVNDHVHVLQKPYTTPHKLIFERGMFESDMLSQLSTMLIGHKLPFPGNINVLNEQGKTVKSYSFGDPIILKWELGDLDGLGNTVLIERLEVAHTGLSGGSLASLVGMLL